MDELRDTQYNLPIGTDCISRKQAIEAVQNRHMMLSKEKVLLINDLEKLPSAQLATDTNVGTKLGTNLAEVGTDCISRQQAIDDIWTVSPLARLDRKWVDRWLRQLPSAQPTFDARDTQYNLPIGTDLISRQALLDKFEPWLKVKDYNDGELNMLKAILYEIRFMRSAQPETATITIGRTKGDVTMWYECEACGEPIDICDCYCRKCGRKLKHE